MHVYLPFLSVSSILSQFYSRLSRFLASHAHGFRPFLKPFSLVLDLIHVYMPFQSISTVFGRFHFGSPLGHFLASRELHFLSCTAMPFKIVSTVLGQFHSGSRRAIFWPRVTRFSVLFLPILESFSHVLGPMHVHVLMAAAGRSGEGRRRTRRGLRGD